MTNIQYIQEDYAIGDSIRISCSLGIKEGIIVAFLGDRIKLRPYESGRKAFSIQNSTITDWEEGRLPIPKDEDLQNLESRNDKAIPQVQTQEIPMEQSDASPIALKPVGYIPPEKLVQIDPTLKIKKSSIRKKMTNIGHSLSDLASLVTESDLVNREKCVSAIGEIVSIATTSTYGFIYDSNLRKKVYFSFSQVVDPEIKPYNAYEQPVVYQVVDGDKGPKAVCIHKPCSIERLFNICDDLLNNEKIIEAIGVLNNILNEYPKNSEAIRKKNALIGQGFYKNAKNAHLVQQNYEQAISLYAKAIEVGDRTESAVKDLCMLLLAIYKKNETSENRERALSALAQYKIKLSITNLSNLYFLEAFYYSIEAFEEYDSILDILLKHRSISNDKKKLASIYTREAVTFIKRHDLENAQYAINDALDADPNYKGAQKLQQVLQDPQLISEENFDSLFNASDFIQLNNGLSPFIHNTLENYIEFYGVPESIAIDPTKFSDTTLKGVRALIEKTQGRARERAKYLLTEAKLITILYPDDITKLKETLTKYCNSMANTHLAENSHMDVVRFYFNQAFALINEINQSNGLPSQVSLTLLTFIFSPEQILTQKSKTISIGNVINMAKGRTRYPMLWDAILEISLNNREIAAHIVDYLYKADSVKSEVIKYLNEFHQCNLDFRSDEGAFSEAWNKAREHRVNSKKRFESKFRILKKESIEDFPQMFLNFQEEIPEWLPELDKQRLNSIRERIVPAIEAYVRSYGYRNKETNYAIALDHINQLIEDIEAQPTDISYNMILQLAIHLQKILDSSFNDVKLASDPKLNISLLSTETVINEGNKVSFQVSLGNDRLSAPIRNIRMSLLKCDGVEFINTENDISDYNALEGGEEKIYRLSAKIHDFHLNARALPVTIQVDYESAGIVKNFSQQISLKLYSPSDFVSIDNPYSPMADGGPVPIDSNMFYGRQAFIESIVSSFKKAPSKQVIIYGQKRCGKSSVLFHLKEALQSEGFFCICFSLGEILQSLSEYSFYYKILCAIKDELEAWEWKNPKSLLPEFVIPSLNLFKEEDTDNPLNTFIKYIQLFKNSCRQTDGWDKKQLVIMIDEFTYLYTGIKSGIISNTIMKQWKAVTQNPNAQFSVVLVGQDVIPSFKKEDYARNAFGVIQDIRLTYLNDVPARDLIENPIRMPDGKSRYVGRAVDRIIDYTSRNPYYIQIFCARLVDYLNDNKSIYITEADVNSVALSFITGDQALEDDKFDNLIRAGESEDIQEFKDDEVLAVLRQVASLSKLNGFCRAQDLDVLKDVEFTKQILNNLVDREVIERIGDDKWKIQVKLFQEWLLNH